jgi:hypothetical protein
MNEGIVDTVTTVAIGGQVARWPRPASHPAPRRSAPRRGQSRIPLIRTEDL